MRIMFQPDALHHQAPSNHTRHHHTLSGPPEKTSGFNIPNAPTASPHAARRTPHAARCTLHAARAAYNHKAAVVGEIIASSIKTRYRIAPFPTQPPCPPFFNHRPQRSTPPRPFIPNPTPASGCRQASHILLRDTRSRGTTNKRRFPHSSLATSLPATSLPPHLSRHISPPHLPATSPRHISPATSPRHISPPHLPATSPPPYPSLPKPSTAASMRSHIGPRPTRIQRFLHMLPTQPH